MPTHHIGPYVFRFYSIDCNEPPHVHVKRERKEAKVWLEPIEVAWNTGFAVHEMRKIERLTAENVTTLLEVWDEHCGQR